MITGKYPALRLRRNRRYSWSRKLIQENTLGPSDFILPIFLIDGSNKKESIKSMPGVYRYTINRISQIVDKAIRNQIPMVALFPKTKNSLKMKISKNIRCLICQGQSIYDSQSDFAVSMKLVIDEKLNEGLSEGEIYDFLKNRYGQWISYDPEFNKNTFIMWLLPILLFLVGGVIIFKNKLF